MPCRVDSFFMVSVPQRRPCFDQTPFPLQPSYPLHSCPSLLRNTLHHGISQVSPFYSVLCHHISSLAKPLPGPPLQTVLQSQALYMPGSTHLKASTSHLPKTIPQLGLPILGFAHSRVSSPQTLSRDLKGMNKGQSCRRVYRQAGWGGMCTL